MTFRHSAQVILAGLFALPLVGCNTLQSIQIFPAAGVTTLTVVGETAQFKATASYQMGSANPTTADITNSATWTVTNPSVATISSSGLATAVGAGTTQILVESGGVSATSSLTVTITASTTPPTLTIIPSASAGPQATFVGETTQFIAFGNLTGTGVTQDLTNLVRWASSDVAVATIDQGGLATAVQANTQKNTSTITAIATTSTGSVINATSTLTVNTGGTVKLPTLAISKVGAGSGIITSSPAGISCGPQATCTGYFPLNTTVTLSAVPSTGSSFGGWSANCVPATANTATCNLVMSTNDTVGAIFNTP